MGEPVAVALRDPLTGLADRRALYAFIDRLIERGVPFGLLLADLDHFKDVNDTLGHDAGDHVLLELARRLGAGLERGSLVARLGGDEFAIVVPRLTGTDGLLAAMSAILSSASEPFCYDGQPLDCQLSLGATLAGAGASRVQAMKEADIALYRAKEEGRSRGAIFNAAMREEVDRRSAEIATARAALARGDIAVFYQPKVSLETRAVVGFEALLRVRDGERMLDPEHIAGAFEQRRLCAQLGRAVLTQLLRDAGRCAALGAPFGHVAINVSDAELRDPSWAPMLLHLLAAAGLPPWALQVEITETVLLKRSAEVVRSAFDLLHAEGVKIALDDFGTGFSSLAHLRDYPVDIIKVDRSFVAALDQPDAAALARATIGLGKTLGMTVVAEGVETLVQHEQLRRWGCDQGQGYLYGRPGPRLGVFSGGVEGEAA
ncbi:putative bifunctional diguanylate cyclase/phosphodiesterase [Sphingomonas mesophila]|uniref:putative bifunctional diguanylate cyclase/phosphodiesterase n=1 Tax=Sphingomonas mesophila TaxID=2303576 RepID=UPI0013C345A2|nr:EAL domain-containing protein [Sphingomonas mesophila]